MQTPETYVADEGYVLTLEQTLVTTQQALIIFSIESLIDETLAELFATNENGIYTFIGIDTIEFGPANSLSLEHNGGTLQFGGWMMKELADRRTDTTRFFAITVSGMSNKDEKDFFIRLNEMANPQNIIIPMETNIGTHEFVLACATGENAILRFTPLGISIERTVSNIGDVFYNVVSGLHFRMNNGEIATFSQLLEFHGIRGLDIAECYEDENVYLRFELTALFREITGISDLAGIILNYVEYCVIDTTVTTPFTPGPAMQPFELQPYYYGHLRLPIEELCANIGTAFRWDDETNSAVIQYRNSSFVIATNSNIVVKNGDMIEVGSADYDAAFISEDGRLMVSVGLLDLMGIGLLSINQCDDGEFLPVSQWMRKIIP